MNIFKQSFPNVSSGVRYWSHPSWVTIVKNFEVSPSIKNSKRNTRFHLRAYDCSGADWCSLRNHLRDVPLEDISKFSACVAAGQCYGCVQVEIDICNIPYRKYQVQTDSCPWFSAACGAALIHRYHLFHLYQHNKFSESKIKYRQASKDS